MVNIGIDARLVDGKGGGTKIYTTILIKHLLKYDRSNMYYLYTYAHHPVLSSEVKGINNVQIRETNNKLVWRTPMIYSLMLKDGIDIIHFPAYNVAPRFLLKRPKIVVTFHGIDVEYFKKKQRHLYWKINCRLSARMSDKIIAVSKTLKKEISYFYRVPESKIITIYYGFLDEKLSKEKIDHIAKKYGINEDDILLLCVDGNEPRKNIVTFIKSIKILLDKYNFDKIKVIITRSSYYSDVVKT